MCKGGMHLLETIYSAMPVRPELSTNIMTMHSVSVCFLFSLFITEVILSRCIRILRKHHEFLGMGYCYVIKRSNTVHSYCKAGLYCIYLFW